MPEEIAHEWPVHIKSIEIPKKRRPESASYGFFSNLKRPRINSMFRDRGEASEGNEAITSSTTQATPYGETNDEFTSRTPVFKPRDGAALKSSLRGSISSLLRERIEARASLLSKTIVPQSLKRDPRSGRVDFEDTEEEIKEELPANPVNRVPVSLLQRVDDFYDVHSDDSMSSMSSMSSDDDDDDDELDNHPLPSMTSRFLRPPTDNKPVASAPFFLSRYEPLRLPTPLTTSSFDEEDEEDFVYNQPDFLL